MKLNKALCLILLTCYFTASAQHINKADTAHKHLRLSHADSVKVKSQKAGPAKPMAKYKSRSNPSSTPALIPKF